MKQLVLGFALLALVGCASQQAAENALKKGDHAKAEKIYTELAAKGGTAEKLTLARFYLDQAQQGGIEKAAQIYFEIASEGNYDFVSAAKSDDVLTLNELSRRLKLLQQAAALRNPQARGLAGSINSELFSKGPNSLSKVKLGILMEYVEAQATANQTFAILVFGKAMQDAGGKENLAKAAQLYASPAINEPFTDIANSRLGDLKEVEGNKSEALALHKRVVRAMSPRELLNKKPANANSERSWYDERSEARWHSAQYVLDYYLTGEDTDYDIPGFTLHQLEACVDCSTTAQGRANYLLSKTMLKAGNTQAAEEYLNKAAAAGYQKAIAQIEDERLKLALTLQAQQEAAAAKAKAEEEAQAEAAAQKLQEERDRMRLIGSWSCGDNTVTISADGGYVAQSSSGSQGRYWGRLSLPAKVTKGTKLRLVLDEGADNYSGRYAMNWEFEWKVVAVTAQAFTIQRRETTKNPAQRRHLQYMSRKTFTDNCVAI